MAHPRRSHRQEGFVPETAFRRPEAACGDCARPLHEARNHALRRSDGRTRPRDGARGPGRDDGFGETGKNDAHCDPPDEFRPRYSRQNPLLRRRRRNRGGGGSKGLLREPEDRARKEVPREFRIRSEKVIQKKAGRRTRKMADSSFFRIFLQFLLTK